MNMIRARLKAVIISVLLLAIILCSIVLYTMETGKTLTAEAGTTAKLPVAPLTASPVVATKTMPVEPVKRTIELTVDGITVTVTSKNHTAADFLEVAGIEIGDEDELFPALDTELLGGENIEVNRTLYRIVTKEVEIPYETEYIDDEEMYEGYEEVEQYGYTGLVTETYNVTVIGGKAASKELISSVEEYAPQNEIIRRGTMVYEETEEEPYEPEEGAHAEETEEPEEIVENEETPSEEPAEDADAASTDTSEETQAETTEESTETAEESTSDITFENDYQRYAYDLFSSYGWTDDDFKALVALWNRESGWNPNAHNTSSDCYGIPQAKLSHSNLPEDYKTNGYSQVDWGLSYISGRYVNPSDALAHSDAEGWY